MFAAMRSTVSYANLFTCVQRCNILWTNSIFLPGKCLWTFDKCRPVYRLDQLFSEFTAVVFFLYPFLVTIDRRSARLYPIIVFLSASVMLVISPGHYFLPIEPRSEPVLKSRIITKRVPVPGWFPQSLRRSMRTCSARRTPSEFQHGGVGDGSISWCIN